MKLLVVESGTKAKAIEKYLGKPWKVLASFGHIQDLPAKSLGYDETTFALHYAPIEAKKATIQKLKEAARGAEAIYIASDPDREGEAIAAHLWELFEGLRVPIYRVRFHEITKTAIQAAVENPVELARPLVLAQETRRLLDRMVGYKVSPLLWRQLSDSKLSAGRVQSAALHLFVQSAREYAAWVPECKYTLEGVFPIAGNLTTSGESAGSLKPDHLIPLLSKDWALTLTQGQRTQKPPTPYITSTLQTDAANKLGMSIKQVMTLAQALYEGGLITYMRTDSTAMAQEIQKKITNWVKEEFNEDYVTSSTQTSKPKPKSKNAQEAHECIRPTSISNRDPSGLDTRSKQLYQLIWSRTVQSQMASATYRTYTFTATYKDIKLRATHEFLDFPGFKAVNTESKSSKSGAGSGVFDESKLKSLLQELAQPKMVRPASLTLDPSLASSPASKLYTEGSFVSKMEELGIGRPSTYVSTLERLFDRGYIEQRSLPAKQYAAKKYIADPQKSPELLTEKVSLNISALHRVMPTELGELVDSYLCKNFPYLCDAAFTSLLENDLDAIAREQKTKEDVCRVLQTELLKSIETLAKEPKVRDRATAQAASRREVTPNITVRKARYGPVIEIKEDGREPRFIALEPYLKWRKMALTSVTDAEVKFLVSLPIPYMQGPGQSDPSKYLLQYGRYGFYLFDTHEKKNVPLQKRFWSSLLPKSQDSS